MLKKFLLVALAWGGLAPAWAGPFPSRPISLVVPYQAGGPTDRLAYELADALRVPLGGATFVVGNVVGGGGSAGAAAVARSKPDGYTLLFSNTAMATLPTLMPQAPFDVLRDFEFLGLVAETPMTLLGRANLPARSLQEARQWMAQHAGQIKLAHAGVGSASQLCGLLWQQALHVSMNALPYTGSAPALADLEAGNVDFLCDQPSNTSDAIAAHKVIAYAITSRKPVNTQALKGLPTVRALGFPGLELSVWQGLYAPKGTPPEVLERISTALQQALQNPQFVRQQERVGSLVVSDARAQRAGHRAFVAAEIARLRPLIEAAGAHAN